ncbi:hypothetical protein AVEN_155356-1 [Araneus ventricosus]|uniref:Uncharacterized protein n=1 Tax=Araneus ventricosus TaxID=182803 RepID=A0A4Y1ZUJ2_ARAVE|nr:hypothetical protein AVEN_155356-1 [Araneus ventricosus]
MTVSSSHRNRTALGSKPDSIEYLSCASVCYSSNLKSGGVKHYSTDVHGDLKNRVHLRRRTRHLITVQNYTSSSHQNRTALDSNPDSLICLSCA